MIMIDDSSSMGEAGPLALSALSTISNALTRLEIGDLCVASFSDKMRILHPFGSPFSDESGAKIISRFKFSANRTMLSLSLQSVVPVFEAARLASASSSSFSGVALQICFVISDARIDSDNREWLDSIVRSLAEKNILVVLVIIDRNKDPKDSIFNTRSVIFKGDKVITSSYFDDFPFPYYVSIQDVEVLPDVLSNALKQWFELIRMQLNDSA
jgi:midasin